MTGPNELKEKMNDRGYRLTPQRKAVLDIISLHRGEHLSSEDIHTLATRDHPGIGLATVYRTLPILEKMDLVKKIHLDDGCIRYELNDTSRVHTHHHLICTCCGAVSEFQEDMLEALETQVRENSGFHITNHSVKFYGLCSNCASSK